MQCVGFTGSINGEVSRNWDFGRGRGSPQVLDDIAQVMAADPRVHLLVTHGASIYAEILGIAEEAEADLIVVGSHRPAMKDYLLGTNAARVVRHACCSALVARE